MMLAILFFALSLLSGVGFYFALPILIILLPVFGIPMALVAIWVLKQDSLVANNHFEATVETVDKKFADDFLLEAINLSVEDQRHFLTVAKSRVEAILKILPSDTALKLRVNKTNDVWGLNLVAKSTYRTLKASSFGFTVSEAFLLLEPDLNRQIQSWQLQRKFMHSYKVLIVDDDIDAATLASRAFERLGCLTEVATTPIQAEKLLGKRDSDLIILDWDLGANTYASDVVAKAVSYIDKHGDDLNVKVSKIVTYSSTVKQDIWLPESNYFNHADHWLKPVSYSDLEMRSKELINSYL